MLTHLLTVNLSQTRISITYGSNTKKDNSDKISKHKAESFVSFKVFDPSSGVLYKLKTHKVKDLSRVLTALGPHGVVITHGDKNGKNSKKSKKQADNSGDVETSHETKSSKLRGFSSVLANAEIEEEPVEPVKETPKEQATTKTAPAKKGKKKKGKR